MIMKFDGLDLPFQVHRSSIPSTSTDNHTTWGQEGKTDQINHTWVQTDTSFAIEASTSC